MAVRAAEAYHRILVPVSDPRHCDEAMAVACRLAADRGAEVVLVAAVEVPADLPLDAQMPDEEADAHKALVEARAIAELYGVSVTADVVRARSAGEAIVTAATDKRSEIVVLGAPRRPPRTRRSALFGRTVCFVLMNAPCRVMVAAQPR